MSKRAFDEQLEDETERVSLWAQAREMAHILIPAAVLIVAAFWFASRFIEPAPPKTIVMATGGSSGAYYAMGKRYAEVLARAGIKVDVRVTAGSVENARLLADPKSGVSVALLQGGIADATSLPDMVSIGRMFLEPVWVFHRAGVTVERLSQLKGKRVAVGAEGSGTRVLATALLKANDAGGSPTALLPITGDIAVDAMAKGEADAVMLVLAPSAPLIQSLLRDQRFKLMSFGQADAYTRLFPYLTKVVLPQGVVDLVANVPAEDIQMVAASAALVARSDIHPALAGLLADAAQAVHSGGSLFYRTGEFPKAADPEFAMSEDAERIFKSGQSFLKRILPFWLAIFIERMIVMIVPIATILLPLFKIVPLVYQWRIKRRIFYWYGQLKRLERRMADAQGSGALGSYQSEIERIEQAVTVIPVPVIYSEQLFNLRSAVSMVRQRISQLQQTLL